MSHLGTRLLADRFADADEGVNAVIAAMNPVLHDGDPSPDEAIAIYSDTRDSWVARGLSPTADDPVITFPMIRVLTLGVEYDSGIPQSDSSGTFVISGTLRIVAQPILQDDDTARATAAGMYILRAMRNVVIRWDDPNNLGSRSVGGIRLWPALQTGGVTQAKIDAPLGDTLVSPGALFLTYRFEETVLLPLA